jgi:hypothetical protein
MILKGDNDIIWGMIYYLMLAYKNNKIFKLSDEEFEK